MKHWMQPANPKIFKITELFQKRDVVDWRQFRNYEIGDIVYLYIARPISQVVFKAEVIDINVKAENTIADKEFWVNPKDFDTSINLNRFYRMKLLAKNTTELLKLNDLCENGLKAAPQGSLIIKEPLLSYIQGVF